MSTTAAPVPSAAQTSGAWSLPSRAMAYFSGPVGLAVKFFLLAVVNGLALWAAVILVDQEKWPALAVLAFATVAIDAVYLSASRRVLPAKFLLPGTVFLLAFQVIPIVYTIQVAFTNYSTGHVLTKDQAIDGIQLNSLAQTPDSDTYAMAVARDEDGKLVLVLADQAGKTYVGSRDGLEPLAQGAVRRNADGQIVAAEGVKVLTGAEIFAAAQQLQDYTVPTTGNRGIRPEGLDTAVELQPTLRYDAQRDVFVSVNRGTVFGDNGRGSFVSAAGEDLEPGWKTSAGFRNFDRVFNDPLIRNPFFRVFAWTLVFATLTVLLSFALGLFLAITLQKKIRFQRLYRTILVIPYAIPSFLTILVWAGLMNDEFGMVNRLLGAIPGIGGHVPWLFDANWARVTIIIVSVWLTFPYFYLVALGALQSIPGELVEAAKVDGAGAWQVFRRITLPLLLVAVAPLMIASFAFNFNNFNNIYLLTGGGPAAADQSVAGETDILISYTYKIAFASGKGQDYALACAISIFIFLIVATISAVAFWRSRTLENIR